MNHDARKSNEGRIDDIAAAARDLIAERGFEGLRTRDIAERVGINVATLHYHVPTKEALIGLVAQSIRVEFIAQYNARPREGLSPLEVLKLEFVDFRETLVENPERYAVLAELSARARRDDEVAGVMRPMQEFWHKMVASIIEAGREQAQFRADVDPEAAAVMVIGTLIATQRFPQSNLDHFDRACAELLRALTIPSQTSPSQGTDKE